MQLQVNQVTNQLPRLVWPLAACIRVAQVAAISFFLATFLGCTSESQSLGGHPEHESAFNIVPIAKEGPIRVVATTGMVAEVVKRVAEEHAEVATLLGPGTDPHLYTPLRDDVLKLMNADAVFYSGLHLEGRMIYPLKALARKKTVVGIGDTLSQDKLIAAGPGAVDPHIWFDVKLWSGTIGTVRAAFQKMAPEHAGDFEANAARYLGELTALNDEIRRELESIPKERRVLITAHDAFSYFGKAYDIEVHGVQGINTESEAGVADVSALVKLIVDRKAPAVFIESSVSDRNIQALIEGCAAAGHRVKMGGELYADAMGPANSSAHDYPGMIRHNVRTIVDALRPTAN